MCGGGILTSTYPYLRARHIARITIRYPDCSFTISSWTDPWECGRVRVLDMTPSELVWLWEMNTMTCQKPEHVLVHNRGWCNGRMDEAVLASAMHILRGESSRGYRRTGVPLDDYSHPVTAPLSRISAPVAPSLGRSGACMSCNPSLDFQVSLGIEGPVCLDSGVNVRVINPSSGSVEPLDHHSIFSLALPAKALNILF
jgi:hypothetical protein